MNRERYPYYFSKSQADDCLSAFSKAELRFPILFEVPPGLEILMGLPVKSPELVPVSVLLSGENVNLFLRKGIITSVSNTTEDV